MIDMLTVINELQLKNGTNDISHCLYKIGYYFQIYIFVKKYYIFLCAHLFKLKTT